MTTNHLDIDLVEQLNESVLPYFGVHPWYSHLFYFDREDHYQNVLSPSPPPELLAVLPEPIDMNKHLEKMEKLAMKYKNAGIGEIGLDRQFKIPTNGYFGNREVEGKKLTECSVNIDHQVRILKAQLELALKLKRQVSLHCVKAHGHLFEMVTQYSLPLIILHSYSGSIEQAKRWKRLPNVFFSFSHWINGKKLSLLEGLIDLLDENQVLIETDYPLDHFMDKEQDYFRDLEAIFNKICQLWGKDANFGKSQIRENINRSLLILD